MATPNSFADKLRPLIVSILIGTCGLVLADTTTDHAKLLIDQGKSQAAYDLLSPLESDRAGDEAFDLLLGIAAADIGRNTNAVMALERVLAVNPNNARARADIARAYFGLGEVKAAREEFETVKQQGIPPEVQQTIDKFLTAVERLEKEGQTTIKSFIEASFGLDNNVNGATSSSQIAIPSLAITFTPTGGSIKQGDSYTALAAGVNLRKPIDGRLSLVAGAGTSKRMNRVQDTFNTGSWDGNVGLAYKEEKDTYSLTLQVGSSYVDEKRYRESYGLSGQWVHSYDQRSQSTLFAQYADLRYGPGSDRYGNPTRLRDAERWVGGAGYAHALRDFKTVVFGSAYIGFENTRLQITPALDHDLWGFRGGAQHQYIDELAFFANASIEQRRHQDQDVSFKVPRKDDSLSVGAGAIFTPSKNWKITPQVQYVDSRSNIAIFKYRREVASVTVRYEF